VTAANHDWIIGLVDKRYKHPGAGRYTAFVERIGARFVPTPTGFRFMPDHRLAVAENVLFRRFSRHPDDRSYPNALGITLQELAVLRMMRRNPGRIFHSVKGETDMHNLPRWSRRTQARLVITFHDALDQFGGTGITPAFLSEVDGVVALCETQRSFFTDRMPPERVRVVHHGVDTRFFHPGDVTPTNPTVISVGSYCRDHKTFTAAVHRVWEHRPDVRFRIVGTATSPDDRPDRIDDDRVEYIDDVSDRELLALYHSSSVAAISLWAATANNALLEAMSCGLPVVATDIGGIPEYLGPDAGLLAPPVDPDAFARAVLEILGSAARAAEMGRAGRERAVACFEYDVVAQATQQFYDDVRSWPKANRSVR
jgi:glycosyltransferase involved in cell wall biosynthesis